MLEFGLVTAWGIIAMLVHPTSSDTLGCLINFVNRQTAARIRGVTETGSATRGVQV